MRPPEDSLQNDDPFNLSDEFMEGLREHFFLPVSERRRREEPVLSPEQLKLDPPLQEFVSSGRTAGLKDVLVYVDVRLGSCPAWLASDSERNSQHFEIQRDVYQISDSLEPLVRSANAVLEYDRQWVERGVLIARGATKELIAELARCSEVTSLISFRT